MIESRKGCKKRLETMLTKGRSGIVIEHDRVVRVRPLDLDFKTKTITREQFDKNRSHNIFKNGKTISYEGNSSNYYEIIFDSARELNEWYSRYITNNDLVVEFSVKYPTKA